MKKLLTVGSLVFASWSSLAWAEGYADEHEVSEQESGGHADSGSHGGHHDPHFSDINWFTGLIGEKEGVEPGLLWRAPGTPGPLGALILNTAILFFLIGRFGSPAISAGLKSRKERIAGDMQRAAAMKVEAEQQLAEYEGKLSEMAAEMTRIKKQMAEQAQHERERVLQEAKARASAIELEARLMVEQQLVHARHQATRQVVAGAIAAARAEIEKGLQASDQERLAKDLLSSVDAHFKSTEMPS
jgi:F-type H+-transporting ATPase subunit b